MKKVRSSQAAIMVVIMSKTQIFPVSMVNCQGLNYKVKQRHIADDFYKFSLTVIMVQEARIKETGLHEFTSSDGREICLYNSGNEVKSIQRVEIIPTGYNVTFNPVSERKCIITTNTSENIKSHLRSTYTPTLENTVSNLDETHISSEQLSSLIISIKQRYPHKAKNKVNKNGNLLIDFVNFIICSCQIPYLNINIVAKQHGSHYCLPASCVKIFIEIK